MTTNDNTPKIRRKIESRMLMQGYTQIDLANKIGVSLQQRYRCKQGTGEFTNSKALSVEGEDSEEEN